VGIREDLVRAEDEGWGEFWPLAASLSREQLVQDGYYPDWSVKDLLAHVGSWQAEASSMLERIRMGTYEPWTAEEDPINREWWEIWREVDLDAVLAHLHSSRARMLEEWSWMPEDRLDREAVSWFEDSGPSHYREHLTRLREWASELAGR
jgi:Mycothiol maleylpyruvate isomerase N-terminal domain